MDGIRSYEGFLASLRCHEWLPDEVSGGSDLDLMLERHGNLLFVEGKRRQGPKISVSVGQWIALRSLSALDRAEVWLVAEDENAKTDDTTPRYSLLRVQPDTKPHGGGVKTKQKTVFFYLDRSFEHLTLPQLQDQVRAWWSSQ